MADIIGRMMAAATKNGRTITSIEVRLVDPILVNVTDSSGTYQYTDSSYTEAADQYISSVQDAVNKKIARLQEQKARLEQQAATIEAQIEALQEAL